IADRRDVWPQRIAVAVNRQPPLATGCSRLPRTSQRTGGARRRDALLSEEPYHCVRRPTRVALGIICRCMRIGILTNEYPPNVYGGAGVHVEYLSRELANLDEREHVVEVVCF